MSHSISNASIPSSDGSDVGSHAIVVEGEEYDLKPSPLAQYMEEHAQNIEDQSSDLVRPKGALGEFNRILYNFYKACSPEPRKHSIRFLPVVQVILWMIFLMTLQTYGNKICQSDNTMCSQAFISLSWGGQYNKIVNPQLWRLITAGFHHQNFLHIIGNTFIILIVSWYIEPKYGSKRLWTVFLLSIFGGNILSWCVYPQELIIIGASGGCYGLLVLLIADCVLNWETVTYRWHILWFSLAFIGQILYDLFAVGNVAVFAHLGGGLGSFFVSIMILPNFYYKPWEKYLTIVCAILCSIQYIVLPAIRYHYVFVE